MSPDGTLATEAVLGTVTDLQAGSDSSLYFLDGSSRVRHIGTDGMLRTVAGTGVSGDSGDGGPAVNAQIACAVSRGSIGSRGCSLVVKNDEIYIAEMIGVSSGQGKYRVRRVGMDGVIRTIAGSGVGLSTAYDQPFVGPALGPLPEMAGDLVVADDGSFYDESTDYLRYGGGNMIYRFTPALPGYDGTQKMIPSEDQSEIYVFDANGHHVQTNGATTGAQKWAFGYDSAGHLASVTDAAGLVTSITRDQNGLPTAIVAPNGQQTTFGLDGNGYLASMTGPAGQSYGFSYTSDGLMTGLTDPKGNQHVFEYDDTGRLVKDTNPAGGYTALSRTGDALNYTVTSSTADNVVTSYAVFSVGSGSVEIVTGGDGLSTLKQDDGISQQTVTRPDGTVFTETITPDPRFGLSAPFPSQSTVSTPGGKSLLMTASRIVTNDTSGALSSLVDTVTVNGKTGQMAYAAASRTWTATSPTGRQMVSTLDSADRVVQVQVANLAPTAYGYDSRGRLSTVTVGTGATARVTTFGYDGLDRLSSATDPLLQVQSYVYDDANRVVDEILTDGSEVGFGHDANGNTTSVTPPGRPEHDFGYTPADLMSSYTPPVVSGTGATTYEYNLDKQPTVIHRPDGSTINFTYDSAGRLSTTTYSKGPNTSDETVTVTRTYDPATGNLSGVTSSDGQSLAYTYDGSLSLSETWSGTVTGSVSRTYDNNFRVASESVNGTNSTAFAYDNDGLATWVGGLFLTHDSINGLTTAATVGTVSDMYQYTGFGELQHKLTYQPGTAIYEENLTRDADGRIEQKTETLQGVTHTYTYSYDSAGRLWQVMTDGNLTATYLYDANGNRTSKATPSATDTGTYDAQDRMLAYGKWTFSYTANGELRTKTDTTAGQVTTYSYDGMGNLRHVVLPDGRTIDYVIDGLNRRVAKKVNGSVVRQWVYSNGLTPAAEFDGNGNLVSRFEGTEYLVQNYTTYRIIKDHLGSPRAIVNASTGAVVQRLDYDEWGNVTISGTQAAGWQPFGFAGGIYDPDTGLVRFGARDYDAAVGRWTAKDPIRFKGGDTSLYVYSLNDPINWNDPSGTIIPLIAYAGAVAVGIAVGVAMGALAFMAEELRHEINGNVINSDKYYHCMANCRASQLGPIGKATAAVASELWEQKDELLGADRADCDEDREANRFGREGSPLDCNLRCGQLWPVTSPFPTP